MFVESLEGLCVMSPWCALFQNSSEAYYTVVVWCATLLLQKGWALCESGGGVLCMSPLVYYWCVLFQNSSEAFVMVVWCATLLLQKGWGLCES